MKVYVLENGSYSDRHIVGVFSSMEMAEIAAQIFTDDASITEWDVDAEGKKMRRGYVPFFVRLHRETGDAIEVEQNNSSYGVFEKSVGEDVHKNLYTRVWALSREEAVKIASERRREFLAAALQPARSRAGSGTAPRGRG